MPDPFPVPQFRPTTEHNLKEKLLVDSDRKYIVQTMATMLMTYIQRPSLSICGTVARALTSRWPFLKDDEGDGEVRVNSMCLYTTCTHFLFLCSTHGNGSSITVARM